MRHSPARKALEVAGTQVSKGCGCCCAEMDKGNSSRSSDPSMSERKDLDSKSHMPGRIGDASLSS